MNIASNGIRLYVDEQGRGDMSLVFLHYWGGSSRTWRHVIAARRNRTAPLRSTIAAGANPTRPPPDMRCPTWPMMRKAWSTP